MTPLNEELDRAMRGESPLMDLHQMLVQDLAQGMDRESLIRELESLRSVVRPQTEDLVLEALDLFAGWCHPDMKL
ncbi:hypothetical protein PV762_04195 [Mitsuaria sp. CC2]|uniref:hypothetical protein n=1 Tax=Mitsuaria sp. CC2 TaxID=3029186 RepID=UPI003B8DA8BD